MIELTEDEKTMIEYMLYTFYGSCGDCIELHDKQKCESILESLAEKIGVRIDKEQILLDALASAPVYFTGDYAETFVSG